MDRHCLIGAGLLLGLLALSVAARGNGARGANNNSGSLHPGSGTFTPVAVTLENYKIASNVTQFAHGHTYHFTVKNASSSTRDFVIAPPLASLSGGTNAALNIATVKYRNIQPGQQVSFNVDFSAPANGPGLEMASYYGNDYQQGMHVPILVD